MDDNMNKEKLQQETLDNLHKLHAIAHADFIMKHKDLTFGDDTLKDVVIRHSLVVSELLKRDSKFKEESYEGLDLKLNDLSVKFIDHNAQNGAQGSFDLPTNAKATSLNNLENFEFSESFISLVKLDNPDNVTILIKSNHRDIRIEKMIEAMVPLDVAQTLNFIYNAEGIKGADTIPLYRLTFVRVKQHAI